MDEQQPTTIYQVVPYEDVRGVAVDAANTALESQSVRTDEEARAMADAAAYAAVDAQADSANKFLGEQMRSTADLAAEGAASKALEGVQGKLDAQLETLQQRSEEVQTVIVQVDSDQWAWIQSQGQSILFACILADFFCAAVLGALVWMIVVGRR